MSFSSYLSASRPVSVGVSINDIAPAWKDTDHIRRNQRQRTGRNAAIASEARNSRVDDRITALPSPLPSEGRRAAAFQLQFPNLPPCT